ncbi:MAG: glutathione S-transferase family protein [Pseudomonadales bacterium]|nr:glutathione S-transferase family protein [Pseudomonadales bacterium]
MNIRVYGNVLSPYARKVYVTLQHKGLQYEIVDVLPHDKNEELVRISPLGKIPALRDGELTFCDSSVICDYLESRYPEPAFYPQDPASRARALWIEEYTDTVLQDRLLRGVCLERVIKPMVYQQPTDENRVAKIIEYHLPPMFDYLEELTGERQYLVDGRFSIADISVLTCFINAEMADFRPDAKRWPALVRYLERIREEPAIKRVLEVERAYTDRMVPGAAG